MAPAAKGAAPVEKPPLRKKSLPKLTPPLTRDTDPEVRAVELEAEPDQEGRRF